jgi:outer membrane protein OmpA-like peptidoglycan-associated protein
VPGSHDPLTLAFRIGIGGIKPLTPEEAQMCDASKKMPKPMTSFYGGGRCDMPHGGDRNTLRVIKISSRCTASAGTPAGGGGGGGAGTGAGHLPGGGAAGGGNDSALEKALENTGKVDIYSIYFSFNSAVIREESEPTLTDIADVLRRHPAWKIGVNGHTDAVGGDQPNLDLSKRRAAAVKDALVKRYGVEASRLATSGSGKSQPRDTNDTLERRARNRRVELVRQP